MAGSRYGLSYTKSMCKHHIVFTPKCIEILRRHMIPEHVYMLVTILLKISISSFKGYLKGASYLMFFDQYAKLKYKYGNQKFGAEGYYVSKVGLNEKKRNEMNA